MQLKKNTIFFLGLTLLNVLIFLQRDYFQYQPFSSYQSLYSSRGSDIKWQMYPESYNNQELLQAKYILETDKIIVQKQTELEKSIRIADFIYRSFHNQIGKPYDSLTGLSPLQQFLWFRNHKKDSLWCGNLSNIFNFFCWSENIACRYVEIMNPGDHHVINECYIPELKSWVMFDITSKTFAPRTDHYLNIQEFVKAYNNNYITFLSSTDSGILKQEIGKNNSVPNKYYKPDYPYYYHYLVDLNKAYKPIEKFKRYFFPVSWYEIYSNESRINWLFYIKELVILSWILFLAYLMLLFFKRFYD